jgi:acetyl-CoA carboxylase carboxyltransferase component
MLFYGRQEGITKEELAKKVEEYRDTSANPILDVSSNLNVQDVIAPAETRAYLIRALAMLEGKKTEHPYKTHGNIPL